MMSLHDFSRQHGRFALPFTWSDAPAITLHCYRPEAVAPDAPVVLVQHGVLRNGEDYRDFWVAAANRYGLQIIAPTFSDELWPGVESYNNGNVWMQDGCVRDAAQWSYSAIPALVHALEQHGVLQDQPIYLFGHSAGGQFVHRLVSTLGAARFAGIAAGNPGWYTLPDAGLPFPEGLAQIGLPTQALERLLTTPLVILAGDRDNDTNAPHLPAEPAALRQGPHRFARAQHYYVAGQRAAQQLGVPLAWQLHVVPGIGHDGEAMSNVCAHWWFEKRMPDSVWLTPWAGRTAA